MDRTGLLTEKVRASGFSCVGCSGCCRQSSEDSNLVLVSPAEIRRIMEATGLSWDHIARPYPDYIEHPSGCRYTLAWCLRREGDRCAFLAGTRCTIYDHRPWICRTYPFMLDGGELLAFECGGIGTGMDDEEARRYAEMLIERKIAEDRELEQTKRQFSLARFPPSGCVVVDGEGLKVVHG
jgi:Fe-S-cluster containining protein